MAGYLCSGTMHFSHLPRKIFCAWHFPRILSASQMSHLFFSCLSYRPSILLLTGATSIQTLDNPSTVSLFSLIKGSFSFKYNNYKTIMKTVMFDIHLQCSVHLIFGNLDQVFYHLSYLGEFGILHLNQLLS